MNPHDIWNQEYQAATPEYVFFRCGYSRIRLPAEGYRRYPFLLETWVADIVARREAEE